MEYLREIECKSVHDSRYGTGNIHSVFVPGPVIVGAGPSGLATAACLKEKGVPSVILERSNDIASLWKTKSYDRLKLHLPKQFCELPLKGFPDHYPTYPSGSEFVEYLEDYVREFELRPVFNSRVLRAEYDESVGFWRVRSEGGEEYVCRWLVVATGENAEAVVPEIEGVKEFGGEVLHTSEYKSGEGYCGKRVLVVGCGNSGMEVVLDLCNHNANASVVIRDSLHILPQQMLGISTFGLSMSMLKWFPIHVVDQVLLVVSWLLYGDMSKFGIMRPKLGPLELKHLCGKTPVLDVGTFAKIRKGEIKVCPSIKCVRHQEVEFIDGRIENFDAIILATGYKSNVPSWLKEKDMFSEIDGFPRKPFPNGWKGENGLYSVGFTKRGIFGASFDARRIADDIERCWKAEAKHLTAVARAFLSET
ncbi:hypothetical protein LguiB_027848 [Lonicera macranthoides]